MTGDEQSNALAPIIERSAALKRRVGCAMHNNDFARPGTNGLVRQCEDFRRANIMPSRGRDFGYPILDINLVEVADQVSSLRASNDPETSVCQVSAESGNIPVQNFRRS